MSSSPTLQAHLVSASSRTVCPDSKVGLVPERSSVAGLAGVMVWYSSALRMSA